MKVSNPAMCPCPLGARWGEEINLAAAHNDALPSTSALRFCPEFTSRAHKYSANGSIATDTWMQTGYSSLVRVSGEEAVACYVREPGHSLPGQFATPPGCSQVGGLSRIVVCENGGADYLSESGMKWMSGNRSVVLSAKRQSDRTLPGGPAVLHADQSGPQDRRSLSRRGGAGAGDRHRGRRASRGAAGSGLARHVVRRGGRRSRPTTPSDYYDTPLCSFTHPIPMYTEHPCGDTKWQCRMAARPSFRCGRLHAGNSNAPPLPVVTPAAAAGKTQVLPWPAVKSRLRP